MFSVISQLISNTHVWLMGFQKVKFTSSQDLPFWNVGKFPSFYSFVFVVLCAMCWNVFLDTIDTQCIDTQCTFMHKDGTCAAALPCVKLINNIFATIYFFGYCIHFGVYVLNEFETTNEIGITPTPVSDTLQPSTQSLL